jgi:hypothetical protein
MAATKPVAGASIESAWGAQVHDAAVTARGVVVASAAATNAGAGKVKIDTVLAGDPTMADLATDELIAPVAGVYAFMACIDVAGYSGGSYRVNVFSGGAFAGWSGSAPGVGSIRMNIAGVVVAAAGERFYLDATAAIGGTGTATYSIVKLAYVLQAQAIGSA